MVFGEYSNFYDALYQDKDYEAEVTFLEGIFERYANNPVRTVLDLGCGTGGHSLILTRRGYCITGVDRSERMLGLAQNKARSAGVGAEYHLDDIRTFRSPKIYDAVISMFAVMSYQTTNDDLQAALQTARRHLKPHGLLVFDVWFGPAVLAERPTDRCKVVNKDGIRIIRIANPKLDILAQTVEINYKVLQIKEDRVLNEVDESHEMRFLFPQEAAYFLGQNGFRVLKFCPFMKINGEMGDLDWNMTVVAEAV